MNVRLMFQDGNLDIGKISSLERDLINDLELKHVIEAMAADDEHIEAAAAWALTHPLLSAGEIEYRQAVLADCERNEKTVRELYSMARDALSCRRDYMWAFESRQSSIILSNSLRMLETMIGRLKKARTLFERAASSFTSEGFKATFDEICLNLTDEYMAEAEECIADLKFRQGVVISAQMGAACEGVSYELCGYASKQMRKWLAAPRIMVSEQDETDLKDVTRRMDRGMNAPAQSVARAAEHLLRYFGALKDELAFYVGCLNLKAAYAEKGVATCIPRAAAGNVLSARALADPSLSLTLKSETVTNDMNADHIFLCVITGANQGGKTIFLRALGAAQLMMQSGMFVTAASFLSGIASGVFTHFRREEDAEMESGKLDEELSRMSRIVDELKRGGMVLFNESFSSTNDREGSALAHQITGALNASGVRCFFVTHLSDFPLQAIKEGKEDVLFLRAQRLSDGTRTFKIVPGVPEATSYGGDVFKSVLG